ncbi:otefin [Scaptodrosophila lebanonensis]|uniref:Otefin n=1 Tax=Drosophila lebanonensis TaxID=7225 RepID=A0A6J2U900_DROLE|nr:otefin [Scaptodrosophila lebanonensis]
MADADNLDALSNAELRKRMVEQGLPNIPVTDSSRKVLVKRLRASIGGVESPAAASPKKAGRRETLHVAAAATKTDAVTSHNTDAPQTEVSTPKARRTIAVAAATSDRTSKDVERPRPPSTKPVSQSLSENAKKTTATAATTAPAPAPAPIQARRRSSTNVERQNVTSARPTKKPETIQEEPVVAAKRTASKNTLLANSLIVLESDDEEDEQLVQAAQHIEDEFKRKEKPKLSATVTSTHEYIDKSAYVTPSSYTPSSLSQPRRFVGDSATTGAMLTQSVTSPAAPARPPLVSNSYDYVGLSRSGRYSSYLGSPAQSYAAGTSTSSAIPAPTSSYGRAPPRTYTNEFSDDNEADEPRDQGPHFESDFARNLARLRAERIGDRGSPYTRRTIAGTGAGGYEPTVRRSLRPDKASWLRWWEAVDREYQLKPKLFICGVIVLLIAVYCIFY